MNILILPSWYRTKDSPLLGSFFREQAIALSKLGHNVSLLFIYADSLEDTYIEEFNDNGVQTFFVHFKKSRLRINRFISLIEILKAFRKIQKDRSPEIIHVHSFSFTKYAKIIKCLYKVPYIVTEHSSIFVRTKLSFYNKLIAYIGFNGAEKVIAVSEGLKTTLRKYYKREIIVLPNMVSEAFFNSNVKVNELKSKKTFSFLSVGYLDDHKGMDILIKAFNKIIKKGIDANLTIGGGGKKLTDLEELTAKLDLESRIKFLGNLSRDEVIYQMEYCDAFVLASRVETFGIVLVEALACGKPIIMTNTDAATTIVKKFNGFVVPIDDIQKLSNSMEAMINKYYNFDSEMIAKDCYDRFSEFAICEELTKIYSDIVNRH